MTNYKGQLYNVFKSDFGNFQSFLQNRERNKDMPIHLKIIANKQKDHEEKERYKMRVLTN